jgi:hypothetical protein
MRRVVLVGVLLLGCNARPEPGDDGAEDEGLADTNGEDSLESGEPTDFPEYPCDYLACWRSCGSEYDQCANLVGYCSDEDTCVCEPDDECLPCAGQVCGPYEVCGGFGRPAEYGSCHLPCSHTFQFVWDPEVGCVITLPSDIHEDLFQFWLLEIDQSGFPRADTCDDPRLANAWVLDTRAFTISLCPDACMAFEAAGQLDTGWGIACE